MIKRTPVNRAVKSFVKDKEQDTYVLYNLMQSMDIDPTDETSFSDLYRVLCDEVDRMVSESNDDEEEFNSRDSRFIDNIEAVLDMIEIVNDVPSPKAIMRSLGI